MKPLIFLKKGFTLVELLIFMGLLSILLVIITQVFVSVLNARLDNEAVTSVEQDGNFIMARLMYDSFRSTNVTLPATAGATGNQLRFVIGGSNYTYALNSGCSTNCNLELTSPLGTDRLNGYNTKVSNLSFTRIGDGGTQDSVQVTFTVVSTTVRQTGTESKNYQLTLSPRR